MARWGYEGTSVPGRFSLVTLRVRNNSKRAFNGTVRLGLGGTMRVGASQEVPCFLGPGDARQVQFYPFVVGGLEDWSVRIGNREAHVFSNVTMGQPATVALVGEGITAGRSSGLRTFPESAFPTSIAGTDGLARIYLDHSPSLQAVQRQVFLDWLRGGGEVHLCFELSDYPRFDGELAILNDPAPQFRIGEGKVVRQGSRLADITVPDLMVVPEDPADAYGGALAEGLLNRLREVVVPDHNWALIYFSLVGFFGAVVFAHRWVSVKVFGYLGSILSLLGVVALATWIMFEVGRRGYGESTSIHSLSYAKVLAPGRYDTTQYKIVFVTDGARYAIRHEAIGSVYSSAQRSEALSGSMRSGADASLRVDIPVFTSRPFVHRAVFEGPELSASVEKWPAGFGCPTVRWEGAPVVAAIAVHSGIVSEMNADGGLLTPKSSEGQLRNYLRNHHVNSGMGYYPPFFEAEDVSFGMLVEQLWRPILKQQWTGVGAASVLPGGDGRDEVRLVVLCPSPEFMAAVAGGGAPELGPEVGMVLYDFVLRRGG
jgi:hypothetical protein